jgi:glycosyltransferase involved in cell wall biosynthesis
VPGRPRDPDLVRVTTTAPRSGEPRVAVVVPCFNDAATLPDTLESLRSEEPHELVVVDDGSDDPATLRVLEQAAANGVHVVRQDNRGAAAARLAGVHATSAPYVFPLDADDLLAPGALTALADALDTNPEAVFAWGDEETFGEAKLYRKQASSLDHWLITYLNEIPASSLIRRDALLAVGGWQSMGHEDWDMWMSFAERGWSGIRIPRVTVFFRLHGARRWSRIIRRYEELYGEFRQRHRELFARRRLNWRRSTAPWRTKLLLPLIAVLPFVSTWNKRRLSELAHHPFLVLKFRFAVRRARGAGPPSRAPQ